MGKHTWQDLDPAKLMPVAEVVGRYTKLEPYAGGYLVGLCPVHDDSTPSLTVWPDSGLWKCWTCSRGGDAADFISFVEHCTRQAALERVALRHDAATELSADLRAALTEARPIPEVVKPQRGIGWSEVLDRVLLLITKNGSKPSDISE